MTDYSSPHQEIFDYVVTELLKQGGPSVGVKPNDGELQCAYRTPPAIGRKCAMGHLIPDSKYDSTIEGWSSHRALEYLNITVSDERGVFLTALQQRHDTLANTGKCEFGGQPTTEGLLKLQSQTWDRKAFYDTFDSFAKRWHLETTVLDELIPEGGYTRRFILEMTS